MDSSTCAMVSGGSTSWLSCQVCLYWNNDRGSCVKSTKDTVSHVCMGDQFDPVTATSAGQPTTGNTAKLDGWRDGIASKYIAWAMERMGATGQAQVTRLIRSSS